MEGVGDLKSRESIESLDGILNHTRQQVSRGIVLGNVPSECLQSDT